MGWPLVFFDRVALEDIFNVIVICTYSKFEDVLESGTFELVLRPAIILTYLGAARVRYR